MTKIIDLLEVIHVGGIEDAVYCSKETIQMGDLLIGQEGDSEEWFDVIRVVQATFLKTGYTMYILTKHIK